MNKQSIVASVIKGMEDVTSVLWSAAALLAPWLVPIAPASFFGWSLFQTSEGAGMPLELATAVGLVGAIGLETVNIAAAHAAVRLSHGREDHKAKFALAVGLVAFYITIGIVSVLMLDVPLNTQIIGVAMFLLAPVAITAQALTMDLARVQDEADREWEREADREQWKREEEARLSELHIKMEHEEKLARIQANAEVRKIKAQTSAERPPDFPERPPNVRDHSPEYAEHLETIHERSAGSPFSPSDVRDWLNVSRTTAYQVLKYGQIVGNIKHIGHGVYEMNGKAG